jgi:hypothetical protein
MKMRSEKMLICLVDVVIHSSSRQRIGLLKSCDKEFIQFIGQVALNILEQVVPLSSHYKAKLRRHADVIRAIGSARITHTRRQKLCASNDKLVVDILKSGYEYIVALLQ